MSYQPTRDSIDTHPVPNWFQDAKLGIFVHWGLYSVPGFAPIAGELSEILASGDWARWFANNPYAEWYMNSYQIEGSATQHYHQTTYGKDFKYADFVAMFKAANRAWNPAQWASLFQQAGAKYVVLTTKHHDGFLLWPSRHANPFIANYQSERDLVGELTQAVRSQGMTMGLYYSGGLDWTFNTKIVQDIKDLPAGVPQMQQYIDYANAHWRELIERYQTAVLWNDIAYPAATNLNELFADFYNTIPEGIVNNRFTQKFQMGEHGILSDNHHDFETPEYTSFKEVRQKKWESCRGVGASFGYNRNEGPAQYQTVESLVRMLVDIVSKNGNLLLNVGPMADGTIDPLQQERLLGLGAWLAVNGEAIYGTRPWRQAEGTTDVGVGVRFTQKGESLYATLMEKPSRATICLQNLSPAQGTTVELLGQPGTLPAMITDAGLLVTLPGELVDSPAYVLKITA